MLKVLFIACAILASCKHDDPDPWVVGGNTTQETTGLVNLAAGKFYKFSAEPVKDYPDIYPCAPWSDGTKLTDEETGGIRKKSLCVCWKEFDKVDITVDLGKLRPISKVGVHAVRDNLLLADYPSLVVVETSLDGEKWSSASSFSFSSGSDNDRTETSKFTEVSCRYVRFTFSSPAIPSTAILLDELTVMGRYENDPKYVPAEGAYHGAFNNGNSFREDGSPEQYIAEYDKWVGKHTSLMLWYQGMKPVSKFEEMQNIRRTKATEGLPDGEFRMFMYGWLPDNYTAAQLATGVLDEYHKEYFTDILNVQKEARDCGPVWFRPANEMNGSWTNYGGDPVSYVRFWRRMYNIAEQVGITDYNVFVWASNDVTYNSATQANPDAKMKDYYPGDQYVDWIGASCYFHPEFGNHLDVNLREALTVSEIKPAMVAEGAYIIDNSACDGVKWVESWFGINKSQPRVKALVWFNLDAGTGEHRIIKDEASLARYNQLVKDPWWLDSIPDDVKKEMAVRKARQNAK